MNTTFNHEHFNHEHISVLLNPHAQQGSVARLAPAMQTYLAKQGKPVQFVVSENETDLERVFASIPIGSRVIGVGGDGTSHKLLPHLIAGGHSYGLVPVGSGNDLARTLGLNRQSWQAALDCALSGEIKRVDVGLLRAQGQQRYFLGCCLFGFDAFISNLTQSWKIKGPIPYLWTMLTQLPKLKGWQLKLSGQDKADYLLLCSILNAPTYGSGYPVAPMADIADEEMNLLLVDMPSRLKVLSLFIQMLRGKHVQAKGVRFKTIKDIEIESPDVLEMSADGEKIDWLTKSAQVEVLPRLLPMVVPSGSGEGLKVEDWV